MGCGCCKKKDVETDGLTPGEPTGKAPASNVIGKQSGAPQVAISKDVLRQKVEKAAKTGVLALRECGLKALPEEALKEGVLEKVRTADLARNQIKALPPTIRYWSSLQTLNASENQLAELPKEITTLTDLTKLILTTNRLKLLPDTLGDMNLKELKCDGNQLPGLPDTFGGNIAATLEELDVSGNALQSLPGSMCSLRALTRLLVQQNQLKALPLLASGEGLAKLQYVDAADNKICSIDTATLQLPALSELWLKGNPMDRLVLQQTPGFDEFAARRKQRLDQKIESHVVGQIDLAVCGL